MMRCSRQGVQQQRQQLSRPGRRHDFFQKVRVVFEMLEAMFPGGFDFVQIAGDLVRGRQSLGQRPLKRIVPKVCGNTAKRLLNYRGAAQKLLAT